MSTEFNPKKAEIPAPIKTLQKHEAVDGLLIDINMEVTEYGNTAVMTIKLESGDQVKLNQRHSGGDSYRSLYDQLQNITLPCLIKSSISMGYQGRTYELKAPTPAQLKKFLLATSE